MNIFIKSSTVICFGIIFSTVSCLNNELPKAPPEYINEINDWHAKRIENLKKENGWLNLVGLYWLEDGENTIGSGSENKIQFPQNTTDKLGIFTKTDSVIVFSADENAEVKINGKKITKIEMKSDLTAEPTILEYKSLRWFIIKRGEKYGVRLRDLEADLVKNFGGIERFPVDEKWKISARFEKYDSLKTVLIPTIIGTVEEDFSPGKLFFSIDEKEFSLEPTQTGKGLFLVFADLTSGEETYGAGRFLYVQAPDSNNNVILDFNKSYNPPCAFTKYATCPLPPDENKLRIKITAGEKNYGEGH
jgi:uncharacterized protein (DUF1684 family)